MGCQTAFCIIKIPKNIKHISLLFERKGPPKKQKNKTKTKTTATAATPIQSNGAT